MDHLPLRHCFSPLGKEGHCHFTDRIRVVFVVFFFLIFWPCFVACKISVP